MQGWRYYTDKLYERDDNMTTICETKDCEEEATTSEEEIRKAFKAMSGSDGSRRISNKGFNSSMPTNQDKKIWPKQWKESVYVPIPKHGDARICSNNRTIAPISHASKVMLKVIQHRLAMYMEQEMAGFRKGRGTRDQISNLRWTMKMLV